MSPAEAWKPADPDDFDPEDMESVKHWSFVDLTIEPAAKAEMGGDCQGFTHWDPDDLTLVGLDAKPGMDAIEDDEDLADVYNVEVWQEFFTQS